MDLEDEPRDAAPFDPRRAVMAAFGLFGFAVAALAVDARFGLVDGSVSNAATLHPLVLGLVALAGLFLVGVSVGLLARSSER